MLTLFWRHRLLATGYLLALLQTALPTKPATAASLTLEPCTLYGSSGATRVEAECADFDRPLDPTKPGGEQLTLRVAVVKSLAPNPMTDAFTLINGGPGGSSIALYADLAPLLTGLLRERDILVVDQRGTGASSPLVCPELDETTAEPDLEQIRQATTKCLAALPVDPKPFTTSVAVEDLDAAREALGYEQLTVYGVSYGTRVAQHYARRFPERTRALIIDGVVPLQASLGPDIALNGQATLDALFDRCTADEACKTAFPALRDEFQTLSTRLKDAPLPLTIPHPITGAPETLDLGYGHLAVAIRLGAYAPETASLIPLQIHAAASDDNFVPIASQALTVMTQLDQSLNYGMHNSVVCTEDVPFYDFDVAAMREQLAGTYLGYDQVEALQEICRQWPSGPLDADFKEPLTTAIPTLLLSGEFDPITPPANAERVLPGLSKARHLIAPGQGHGVIGRGCVPSLLREFVETADPDALDAECLERLAPDPFFIDLMGPAR